MSEERRLVGISEIAEVVGLTRQAVANWRERYADFPKPISELKSGPIWWLEDILLWAKQRGIEFHATPEPDTELETRRKGLVTGVINMKGGVGKSTVTANLGLWCAYRKNMPVLLIDLDPQFNLSQYVIGPQKYEEYLNAGKGTVLDIFEQATPAVVSGRPITKVNPEQVICPVRAWKDGGRVDIIPSRLELAWTLKNSSGKVQLLEAFVNKIRRSYDLILVDCPPTESMLTESAYLASDYVLVPVRPEFLSTIGLPLLAKSLEEFHTNWEGHHVRLAGIVFNDTSEYKEEHIRSRAFVEDQAKAHLWPVFEKEISHSDSYPKGARMGMPIFLTEYARYWKIAEFDAFAEEFIKKVGL